MSDVLILGLANALAWPAVTMMLGLAVRSQLLAFLSQLPQKKGSLKLPGGFEATYDGAEQQTVSVSPSDDKLPPAPVEPSPRPAVNVIAQGLIETLAHIADDKQVPILTRALAEARLQVGHEFAYNRIYGSQILALRRLNQVDNATISDALEFFAPYPQAFPFLYKDYGFDGWLNFLKVTDLIVQSADSLRISVFGRDFLIYLTEQRLNENKPG